MPRCPRNADMQTMNRELTKRTLAEKLSLWRTYANDNINAAKARAVTELGDSSKFLRFLPSFTNLSAEYQFYPCLVVGYGPSFHDNLHKFKELRRDKCKIIASERCLPEMYYQGVLPDAVINLDSGDQIKHFFFGTPVTYLGQLEGVGAVKRRRGDFFEATELGKKLPITDPKSKSDSYKKDISHWIHYKYGYIDARHRTIMKMVLEGIGDPKEIAMKLHVFPDKPVPTNGMDGICAITTNPDIRKWFRGRIYWFNPTVYPWKNTLTWDVQKKTGFGALPTGGNVGTTSLCIALSVGCEPLFLVGVDFCHRIGGFDPSTLAVIEYQVWCPKCHTPHRATVRATDPLPTKALCQNKDCKFIYNPMDPDSKAVCTNTSYKAYAFSMRQLLTSEVYKPIFDRAKVFNLSGGILHGSFIKRAAFDNFASALVAWDKEKEFARLGAQLQKDGRKNNSYTFRMSMCSYEDESGKYIMGANGEKRLTKAGFELKGAEEEAPGKDDDAKKVAPIVGLKEVPKK